MRLIRLTVVAVVAAIASILMVTAVQADDKPQPPQNAIIQKSQRFVPKPPGTKERLNYWFGPYVVPPGHDMNRVDIDLPVHDGFILSVEPKMRRADNLVEVPHQQGHIHHAHWFA